MKRILNIFILAILAGCNFVSPPTKLPVPTITFIPTQTHQSAPTLSPTSTPTPIQETTATHTSACAVSNGKWESLEMTDLFGASSHLLTFDIADCKIVSLEIWSFPAPRELFFYTLDNKIIPVIDMAFSTREKPSADSEFTIEGQFDTPSSSHGTIQFPKGFLVVDYVLKDTVVLEWTASLQSAMAPREVLEEAGFSYQAPSGYHPTFRSGLVNLSNADESVFVMLIGTAPTQAIDLETELNSFVAYSAQTVKNMQVGTTYPLAIGDFSGLAVDISGQLYGNTREGTILAVSPAEHQLFIAFGIGINEPGNQVWQDTGKAQFLAALETVQFFQPVPMTNFCPITADPTFGYNQDNPIRVGGSDMEGPARERTYLDHLLGPQGQTITYEHSGSNEYNGVILDIYQVTYPGQSQPATLYVDEYHYGPLKAPLGFTCDGQFPLKAPQSP